MRMLFSTTAGTGHFSPMVPLAHACLRAGHQVLVAAPGSFASHVARSGLAHAPFADAPAEVLGEIFAGLGSLSMDEANARVVREVFGRHDARAAFPGIIETVHAWRPDLIIRDPAELGSLAAASLAKVPQVEVAIGLREMQSVMLRLLEEPLAELESLVGLDSGTLVAAANGAPSFTMAPASIDGAPVVESRSSSWPLDSRDRPLVWRYRSTAQDGGATMTAVELPEWGEANLPLVYVTFGTVAAGFEQFAAMFRIALDALADLPVRVLLTTGPAGDPESLRPWPANAQVERWWPQTSLMRHTAAVVGHGGFGTTLAAIAGGVPQVVVPMFASDQWINARRVAEAGAGISLNGGTEAATRLAEAVTQVLEDAAYRRTAAAIAAEIAGLPTSDESVQALVAVAR